MLTDVDLPAPGLLWTRWATLSATHVALGRAGWSIDDGGAGRDLQDGSWARFALLDGRRAVLYGHHAGHSAAGWDDAPADPLTGAPDWLPWDTLAPLAEGDRLGFVVWHESGRWSRVRYRGGRTDGMADLTDPVSSGERTVLALSRFGPRPAAERLLAAAVRTEVSAAHLGDLLTDPSPDLAAALATAARGGLVPGSAAPRIAPGRRPPMRRVRRLSQGEHDRLVWSAMQDSPELSRPAPPVTDELDTLVGWLQDRAPQADGRCSLLAYADATSFSAQPGEHPPDDRPDEERYTAFRRLTELVRALRRAESDPRYGRWLFLRVETSASGVQVERRYDSWPPWWHDDGVSGPWRTNLQEEMDARLPRYRPSWVPLLDPEVAFRPQ
ncbi:hypothetical protein Aph02nite_64290 [Actinoplanes philippinensis]|uniref:Uncharacterized protein n=1 Tax=Actinoplanes philippinensis TaxID=35752 RepID=A0A1I2JQB3_9ACTN|nr:hypothetical protein [Actinoplanes philippinensis]GIE80479.1 hypothetical protein Aph02nite_64290 [Actinoplanes philippinensis]SFF55337.1 hypothetical protein SAMN05421541_11314 [Actinoplanes philippinensis]